MSVKRKTYKNRATVETMLLNVLREGSPEGMTDVEIEAGRTKPFSVSDFFASLSC